jgi:pyrrolidone-carboxylate peptidase
LFCLSAQSMNKHILVTAFEPFGFSTVNRSIDTAQSIKSNLQKNGFIVDICILPVIYNEAAKQAIDCFLKSKTKPLAVISLGEGGCDTRLETAAHNRDSAPGFPDNQGNIRTGTLIDETASKNISFKGFVIDMYCAFPSDIRSSVSISESPGGFVCNNTAFILGNYFSKINVPYTFIHVPNNMCSEGTKEAEKVGKNLAFALSKNPLFNLANKFLNFETICNKLPTTIKQTVEFLEIIEENKKNLNIQCGKEFILKLKKRLELWVEKNSTY